MDFLDSFDVDIPKYKKSRRVRSWYLYEQFKSLERNQLDAASKLKSRSYQDKILRQELFERKARRKLYDQFGHSQSDCGIEPSVKSEPTKTSLNVSTDDFIDSFHEFEDDEELTKVGDDDDDNQSDCHSVKFREDDFRSVDDQKEDQSYPESVNVISEETLTERIEIEKLPKDQGMPTHMELNFDMVKDKFHCLDTLNEMGDMDKYSENDDVIDDDDLKHIIMQDKNVTTDNNIYFMWTKLVSFAYQIMELNHGNCYYDYGSQFLTAVLACDVLRRGINRMCHILQPYVSPLEYSTDSDSSEKNYKINRKKKLERSKYYKHNHKRRNLKSELDAAAKRICFEHILDPSLFLTHGMKAKKYDFCTLYVNTCTRCRKVVNPMLHVTRDLDKIMRHVDDVYF